MSRSKRKSLLCKYITYQKCSYKYYKLFNFHLKFASTYTILLVFFTKTVQYLFLVAFHCRLSVFSVDTDYKNYHNAAVLHLLIQRISLKLKNMQSEILDDRYTSEYTVNIFHLAFTDF